MKQYSHDYTLIQETMKQKLFHSASRMSSLALALVAAIIFTACGDGSSSVEDLLSDNTTPVSFQVRNSRYIIFDYAGSHYVGSDTVEVYGSGSSAVKVDLRQGQHQLLWFDGISKKGANFDPSTKRITTTYPSTFGNVKYSVCDVSVTEYVSPVLSLVFQPLTALPVLFLSEPNSGSLVTIDDDITLKINGIPAVTSVSVLNGSYERAGYVGGNLKKNISAKHYSGIYEAPRILCPKDGIDGVRLSVEMSDKLGNSVSFSVPPVSFRPGQVTAIYLPYHLDWNAECTTSMMSFEDYEKW